MAKIAMLGAGSLVFCKTLMADFLATPALAGSEYRLMALTHTRLDKMHGFVRRMIQDNGVNATVTATTDRREALRGADYVVVMIQAGGVEEFRQDYEIPLKYGVDQCIGDTMGPGGFSRALRHVPACSKSRATCRSFAETGFCYLRKSDGDVCWALGRVPGLQFVGLCHGCRRQWI